MLSEKALILLPFLTRMSESSNSFVIPLASLPKSQSFAGSAVAKQVPLAAIAKSSSFRANEHSNSNVKPLFMASSSKSTLTVCSAQPLPSVPPITKTGTVLRRTGFTRTWKEKQMFLDAADVGVLIFPDTSTKLPLHGRFNQAYVEVMWVWEEKSGQKHRMSITTASKHTEVVETENAQELEAWLLAFQSHGCEINRPVRAGPLSVTFPSSGDFWFVLYPDGLRWFKKKTDVKIAGVIPIGEGSVAEIQANGTFLLEETGDEQAKCIAATPPLQEASKWFEDIERVVANKHKKKYQDSIEEGYLYTCGAKHGKWKKRFCVLKESEMIVYKKRFDEPRVVTVRLPPGADAESVPDITDRFAFWVAETGDEVGTSRYYFSTKNVQARDHWLHTFQTLFNSKNNNVYENSMKEGYLYKQTAADGAWVKKYFVLQKDTLLYATKRKHTVPDKIIDMNHGFEFSSITPLASDITARTRPGMFSVAENGDEQGTRTYVLHAKDIAVRAAWMQAFANLLKTKDTRVNPNSLKEGYMRKQKRDKSKWSKCYFILTSTSLSYYRKRNDKSAVGEFLIEGCTEISRLDAEETSEHRYQFSLAESGDESAKIYFFSLAFVEMRTQWMNALLKLIRSKESKVHPGSTLEGYLMKYEGGEKSHSSSSNSNNGRKLYFVLCDNVMSYYKRRLDSSPMGKLVIQGEAEIHLLTEDVLPFSFSVAKTGDEGENVLKICATDMHTCLEWVKKLRLQASRFVVKEDPNSLREGYVYLLQGGKEWHKRYYILESSCLSIYTKRKDNKPSIKFALNKDSVVVLLDGNKPPPHGSVWGTHSSDEKSEREGENQSKEIQLVLCESGDASAKSIRLRGFNESEALLTSEIMDLCLRHEFSCNDSSQLVKSGHFFVLHKNRPVSTFVELTPERLIYHDPATLCSTKSTTLEIGQGFQTTYNGLNIRVMDRKEKEICIVVQSEQEKKSWATTLELFLLSKDSERRQLFGGSLSATFTQSPFYRHPSVISSCVEYLKQQSSYASFPAGVCLLASPGFHPLVRSFIQDFENGLDVTLTDPRSVITCLKVYLLMLDQPLISDSQVMELAKAVVSKNIINTSIDKQQQEAASKEQISGLQKVLKSMDVQTRMSVSIILHYLNEEINRPEEVEVTALQVLAVWAPILMRCQTVEEIGTADASTSNSSTTSHSGNEDIRTAILSALLNNIEALFPSGTPVAVRRLPTQQLLELKAQAKTVSFDMLRKDKLGFALLTEWCKENFVEENMLFLLALDRYRYLCSFPMVPQHERSQMAKQICATHIKKDADMQLNISSELADSVLRRFEGPEQKTDLLTGDEFTAVESEVHVLIATNEFPRFKNSEAYDIWIAHQHEAEKRASTQLQPQARLSSSVPPPTPAPFLPAQPSLNIPPLNSQHSSVVQPPLPLAASVSAPSRSLPHGYASQTLPASAFAQAAASFQSVAAPTPSNSSQIHRTPAIHHVALQPVSAHSHHPNPHNHSYSTQTFSTPRSAHTPHYPTQTLPHQQSSQPPTFHAPHTFQQLPLAFAPQQAYPPKAVLVAVPVALAAAPPPPPSYNQATMGTTAAPPSYSQSLSAQAKTDVVSTPQATSVRIPRSNSTVGSRGPEIFG